MAAVCLERLPSRQADFRAMHRAWIGFGWLHVPCGNTHEIDNRRRSRCGLAEPTELARSTAVLRLPGTEAPRVRMVFITVDPERDTPELLRNYVHAFNPSFLGLRADLATIAATARRFHAFYTKVATGDSYTTDHTTIAYAIDRRRRAPAAGRAVMTLRDLVAGARRARDRFPQGRARRAPSKLEERTP